MTAYPDAAAQAAHAMWRKGFGAHQIRAALEHQFPREGGWSIADVHRAVAERARQMERDRTVVR